VTSAQGDGWAQGSRAAGAGADDPEDTPVVIRDRRRIDPESGQVRAEAGRTAADTQAAPPPPGDTELVGSLRAQVTERTLDLQRLKAEFDNYRRRVERDRQAVVDQATAKVLIGLLSTLDDIGRARDHGDLEGPFKSVAESLETTLEAIGLERFGSPGDEFDPAVHEALLHSYRADLSQPTCVEVFRAGYRYRGRVLRPAQVSVAEPPVPDETVVTGEADGYPDDDAAGYAGDTGRYPGEPAETGPETGVDTAAETAADTAADTAVPSRPEPVPDDTGSIPGPESGPVVSAD
jgi:molecular chaperone GrpE